MPRCRLVATALLASACGASVDPMTVNLEGEWAVQITNVRYFELTCSITFSMQLLEIDIPDSYDGEIPRDTGIRCPNGFIYPLDRQLSNLVFQPNGKSLKVTVGVRPFAVVDLQSENEMKGDVDEAYFSGGPVQRAPITVRAPPSSNAVAWRSVPTDSDR